MKVIGISAHAARSGKDTLAKCLQILLAEKGQKVAIRSLATPLKERMKDFIWNEFQIDIDNCSDEDKAIVRPLMVGFGGAKRKLTKGKFFTNLMDLEISKLEKDGYETVLIPDIRYADFKGDEVEWLKTKDATLFFVSMLMEDGSVLPPPNEDEERNSPLLREASDFQITWPHMNLEECLYFVRRNWNTYVAKL